MSSPSEGSTVQSSIPHSPSESTVRQLYLSADVAHDFDHVLRVTQLGLRIAQAECADTEVVRAAALLHDLPVSEQGRDTHHFAAAEFAAQYLSAAGMDAPRIENVVHCIQAHRYRDRSVLPQTLEAKCLYDADKLDSIGAIGVARAFAHAGNYANRLWSQPATAVPPDPFQPTGPEYTPVHEFVYKLRQVLATLHTPTARKIGQQRHEFMVSYFEQLDAEMTGRL
ncbi:MAG: HD domain-containing protein [Caldilineaceae bacterium SB0668_bin_21]|nr:HD domain-containing protein [Caldilineaceae bacterium SB0668_bin_21]MYC22501.1 HD domain-containing protein [Caldilineaceae bacterium SB0662_bin_25]